ncbi:MAG: phosphoribosyltransferase [Geodermatophilaceae bacterium]|nr:phosphoribosyltransferase [Geodermatophilaceae bacterium]
MIQRRSAERFLDRRDAGRRLAETVRTVLPATEPPGLIVLGLPRGGVVVADELATVLAAQLDALIVRKISHPSRPELALGAVTAVGVFCNESLCRRLGVSATTFEELAAVQAEEVRRRERSLRGDRPPLALSGRTVLVIDDGLATGATATAALRAARTHTPAWLGFAAPVGSASAAAAVAPKTTRFVCPVIPTIFMSVSRFYRAFPQVTDAEVVEILTGAA